MFARVLIRDGKVVDIVADPDVEQDKQTILEVGIKLPEGVNKKLIEALQASTFNVRVPSNPVMQAKANLKIGD